MSIKNFNEWLLLRESMDIYIKGVDSNPVEDLDRLSEFLKRNVLYPMWDKLDPETQQAIQDGGSASHSMITPDGCYYSGECQTINFYTQGWGKHKDQAIQGIKYFLDNLKVKYSSFESDKSGMFDGEVVRFDILQMPKRDQPASLNLSNANAKLIFGDLLKFPEENSGFFDIDPRELLMRIENLDKDKIGIHARDPYSTTSGGVTMFTGGYSSESIANRLEQIKQIARWAIDNHYDEIYVA